MVHLGGCNGWPRGVMAGEMDISTQALCQWVLRQGGRPKESKRGRPKSVPAYVRWSIRQCYLVHYCQWGPRVLAAWAEREGLGRWSATTIARVIEDLKEKPEPKKPPLRYEVCASGVMWSEDGTGFRENGRKKELLVAQDEHARFKVNHRLANGPANEEDVYEYLCQAFQTYGAPLVLKHDGGSIFHGERIRKLLEDYLVTDLTGPPSYPQYNGKMERSMRDIKSYERAMRRRGVRGSLKERIQATICDLNEHRPRPVLAGRIAREVFEQDRILLPDRGEFRKEVTRTEKRLWEKTESRRDKDSARRRAVEEVLLRYSLMKKKGDVSTNLNAISVTF